MKTLFLSKLKANKKVLMGKNFHPEHFNAALEIMKIMASDKPNTNHIILDAPTQSGKTSVMEMVYRLLNYDNIYEKYGIENVLYMTSDNGSGKGALKFQTKNRFEKHWITYIHTLPIEFLKRSDFDKFLHYMPNTLIMWDESQYGLREITSKGQTFLRIGGVDFISGENLQKHNTYILSVSATTENERFGDSELKLKPIVKLQPGKGYIGFEDFFEMGIIKPVYEENFINTYEKLDAFLGTQAKKLKQIYKETGVSKCVILRLFDNKRNNFYTDSEEFASIANNNGFTLEVITCKESKIDYSQIEMSIFYNCNHYRENGRKFHLIVIKNAFSYGITISPETKKLISTCYDVRKDVSSTEATQQGLLGRMSGYECKKSDFENLEIYINETHYEGIKESKIDGTNEYSTPLKSYEKAVKVKCERKDWDGKKNNIVIFNNEYRKPLIFEGKIVDDWVKDVMKRIDISPLFSEEDIPKSVGFDLQSLAEDFLKKQGIYQKMGFRKDFFDSRRQRIEKDGYAERMCTDDPLLTNGERDIWQKKEKAERGAICWGALFDITKVNPKTLKGLVIKIPYGYVGFAKIDNVSITKSRKKKMFPGFNTTLNQNIKKAEVSII